MKELIVISGKGGTGKTSLTAAFAQLAESKILCDADVDAADLHLIVSPEIRQRQDFQSGHTAIIDRDRCTECGLCREMCRWQAVDQDYRVDPIACEGCGVCVDFCPAAAIEFPLNTCGEWYLSDTRFGPMVHARLGIAEENSGKLVTLVRQEARKLGETNRSTLILTDGPPGVGCPVIASIGGADAVLIVTEPSISGRHDMTRVAQLAAHFNVPAMVCVNKFDINLELTEDIEAYAREQGMMAAGRIPFDPIFVKAMVQAQTVFEHDGGSAVSAAVRGVWRQVTQTLFA